MCNQITLPKVLFLPPAGGKTTLLIGESRRTGYTMVVRDEYTVSSIEHRAKKLGYNIPVPITFYDFVIGAWNGKGIKGFLIDDVQDLVKYMAKGTQVYTITLRKY